MGSTSGYKATRRLRFIYFASCVIAMITLRVEKLYIMKYFLFILFTIAMATISSALRPNTHSMRGQMSMMARKPIMAGNWKMNTDLEVC